MCRIDFGEAVLGAPILPPAVEIPFSSKPPLLTRVVEWPNELAKVFVAARADVVETALVAGAEVVVDLVLFAAAW